MTTSRWIVTCAAVIFSLPLCAHPIQAQSPGIAIELRMDWSGEEKSKPLATDLVNRGRLPVPLIFVGGQVRALLDDGIKIAYSSEQTEPIDIGVLQFIERPLYAITSSPTSDVNTINVTLSSMKLTAGTMRVGVRETQRVLTIDESIDRKFSVARSPNGSFVIRLPAGPYATIARFLAESKQPIDLSTRLPVRSAPNKATTLTYLRGHDDEIIAFAQHTESSRGFVLYTSHSDEDKIRSDKIFDSIPEIGRSVNAAWLRATAFLWEIFASDKPEPILLKSIPSDAQIFVSGIHQATKTDGTISVIRRIWNLISLKREGHQCQVDISKVRAPVQPTEPSVFECRFAATSP